jgi:hypothetical protein
VHRVPMIALTATAIRARSLLWRRKARPSGPPGRREQGRGEDPQNRRACPRKAGSTSSAWCSSVPRERAIQIVAKQRRPPDERADKRDRQLARLILRTASPVNRRNVADALAGSDYRRTMKGIPVLNLRCPRWRRSA